MLLASGYDRLETIAHMDVSESGRLNDIDGILDHVRKNFPNNARLVCRVSMISDFYTYALYTNKFVVGFLMATGPVWCLIFLLGICNGCLEATQSLL